MDIKIKTFIFDCFGVVCNPALNGWYRDNGLKYGFVDNDLFRILENFDLGNLSEDDIAEHFSKYKGINLTKEEIQGEIDRYLKFDSALIKEIKKLKELGFKIVLLSNTNASFFERKVYKIYPEFKNLFDEIIISSEVKMVKPNKDIYLYTLKKINSKPEESLFIDDNKRNVDAAIDLGINGFLYTDNDSFSEYLKKLKIF